MNKQVHETSSLQEVVGQPLTDEEKVKQWTDFGYVQAHGRRREARRARGRRDAHAPRLHHNECMQYYSRPVCCSYQKEYRETTAMPLPGLPRPCLGSLRSLCVSGRSRHPLRLLNDVLHMG